MRYSYHSKVRSTQNKAVQFSFVWNIGFGIIFLYLDRAKAYTVNSNLTKLVDIQRLHENI